MLFDYFYIFDSIDDLNNNKYISIIFLVLIFIKFMIFISLLELSFFLNLNYFIIDSLIGINITEFLFSFRVLLISFIIILFRIFYIKEDFSKNRFFILTIFFIIRIITFIFSKSLIILILGWEGLGIFSYLLIIYYLKNNSLISGFLTLIVNRVGDVFLIVGLRLWLIDKRCFLFSNKLNNFLEFYSFILFFLLISIITKRPQYPFNSWLLAAISAPTPISSLVHSSTLVTAGCFFFLKLIINFFFFKFKIFFLNLIILTIFLSSLTGLVINDIKKIIALSTLSQISLVFLILLINLEFLGVLHLIFHAFFKSSLFLISGYIILYRISGQDNRFQKILVFNNLIEILWIYVNFSLTALFFSFRFFSKEKLILYFINFDLWYNFFFFSDVY